MTRYSKAAVDLACRTSLRRKYLQIAQLRHPENASISPAEARRAMRQLAADFPGSLRELDALPMAVIDARLAELDATHDHEPEAPWMRAQHEFHALVRGVLLAKRWLRAHPGGTVDHFIKWTEDADALLWSAHLAQVADPPSGRLLELVFPLLAERLESTQEEARALVLGEASRSSRRQ